MDGNRFWSPRPRGQRQGFYPQPEPATHDQLGRQAHCLLRVRSEAQLPLHHHFNLRSGQLRPHVRGELCTAGQGLPGWHAHTCVQVATWPVDRHPLPGLRAYGRRLRQFRVQDGRKHRGRGISQPDDWRRCLA